MIEIHIQRIILLILVSLTMQQQENGEDEKVMDPEISPVITGLEKLSETLPSCAEDCLKPLLVTLRASFVSGNNYERLVNTCDRLRGVYKCMDRIKKCQKNDFFYVATDGLKYMCVEHQAAFRDLMECMDLHTHIAIEDCRDKCNVHKLIIGWFIYSVMRSTTAIEPGEKDTPPRINKVFFNKITSEACTILECYFLCLKTKYNSRCYGVGGNLLLEVLVRPLHQLHKSHLLSPFWNLANMIMPNQCSFMTTDSGRAWQRIDPKLEEDLKKFYLNRTEPLVKFRRQPEGLRVETEERSKRDVDCNGNDDKNFIPIGDQYEIKDEEEGSTEKRYPGYQNHTSGYDYDGNDDDNAEKEIRCTRH